MIHHQDKILQEIHLLINYAPNDIDKNSLSHYISILLLTTNNIKNEHNDFVMDINNRLNRIENNTLYNRICNFIYNILLQILKNFLIANFN